MMKEEFLDSYNGYHLGFPMDPMEAPSLFQLWATTTATTTPSANVAGTLIRRLGFGWPSGGRHPKQARVALGRK